MDPPTRRDKIYFYSLILKHLKAKYPLTANLIVREMLKCNGADLSPKFKEKLRLTKVHANVGAARDECLIKYSA